jgi:hypothetical protein
MMVESTMNSGKSLLIGALLVAVAVLGYLYYQETRNTATLSVELPKVRVN